MGECISKYFIWNNEIKQKEKFDEKVIINGKTIYEVIRVIEGVPIFFEKHMKRLNNSLKLENKPIILTEENIVNKVVALIKANNVSEGNIKIIINFSTKLTKENNINFLAYFIETHYPSSLQYEYGVPVILFHGMRKNPNAKVINTEFRSRVESEINENNSYEAILVDDRGNITEGSKSNIFMIKGNNVITAPLEDVLPGITREVIIEVCNNMGYYVKEERINYNDLNTLDALFISGTSPKVLPIRNVNNVNFDSAKNNVVINIMKDYNIYIDNYIFNSKINFNKI